jgi:hypothetical protein
LDAIAITDHIEHQPHRRDVSTNHNRSYEIARATGRELDLLVIHGSEITRKMPPGHLNAIFLKDSESLAVPEWRDCIRAAHAQGAFIFWNHPNYPGGKGEIWYPEHTELLDGGYLQGIEVVNGRSYYPKAHRWAIEKNLTMLSNSDIHMPLNLDYHVRAGDHRPVTLVFARERTADAIHEALLDRRTAVYSGSQLIGAEQFLKPLFENSIRMLNDRFQLKGKARHHLQIHNHSDLDFQLKRKGEIAELNAPAALVLPAGKTVLFEVRGKNAALEGEHSISLPYRVENLLVGPDQPFETAVQVHVDFVTATRGGE